ncbi:hypothetical protein CFR72_12570 [Gluconacetobacter entanii]|uniref:Uncharacterized protein n=1 Tax=Gluconacetobacter entanii TaxID=108528 RepID=A0A318PPI0_9PROT|nr:hypothetical protein CFR72_12570 [Gluconacetobacter entanii]
MIGHEIMAKYRLDHSPCPPDGISQPCCRCTGRKSVPKCRSMHKRVRNLTDGTEDERSDAVMNRAEAFPETPGVPTRVRL